MKCFLIFTATVFVGAYVSASTAGATQQTVRYVFSGQPGQNPHITQSTEGLDAKKIHEQFVAQFQQQQRLAHLGPQHHHASPQNRIVTTAGSTGKVHRTRYTAVPSASSQHHHHHHHVAHSTLAPAPASVQIPVQQVQLPNPAAQAQAQTEAQIIQYIVQQQQAQAQQQQIQAQQQAAAQAQAQAAAQAHAQEKAPVRLIHPQSHLIKQEVPQQFHPHPQFLISQPHQPQQFQVHPGRPGVAPFLVTGPAGPLPGQVPVQVPQQQPGKVLIAQPPPQYFQQFAQQSPHAPQFVQTAGVVKTLSPVVGKAAHIKHHHGEPAITVGRVEGHAQTFSGPGKVSDVQYTTGFTAYSHAPVPVGPPGYPGVESGSTAAGTNAFVSFRHAPAPAGHPGHPHGAVAVSEPPTVTYNQFVAHHQQIQPGGGLAPAPVAVSSGPAGHPGLPPNYQFIQIQQQVPQPQQVQISQQQLQAQEIQQHQHHHQQQQQQRQQHQHQHVSQVHVQPQQVEQVHIPSQSYNFQTAQVAGSQGQYFTVKHHQPEAQSIVDNRIPEDAGQAQLSHGLSSKVPLHSFAQIGNSVQELSGDIPNGFGLSL